MFVVAAGSWLVRGILGGLIFGTYAQQSGADHLMQPKRSSLFLALSLGERAGRGLEGHLFERFAKLAGRGAQEVPYTPTFFPRLLSESDGPRTFLRKALGLRRSPEVRQPSHQGSRRRRPSSRSNR